MTELVFDTTCPTHFARAGHLEVLATITAGYLRVAPQKVMEEARDGALKHPAINDLLALPWPHEVELDIFQTVRAASFKAELGGEPDENLGECEALALAESLGAVAVIDDSDGAAAGRRHDIQVVRSLGLLARGRESDIIDVAVAAAVVDDLLATGMRLPLSSGAEFDGWARARGLIT